MASAKKRKAGQETDNLSNPTADAETKPQHPAGSNIRQPDDESGAGRGTAASDGDDDYENENEDVRKLLATLNTDQLISLLVSAATRDPATLADIHALADLDPAHRKLFVHNLDWDTTSDCLRSAFSRYGDLDDCHIVVDRTSGRSKGYGFVLFRHRSSARRALLHPDKLIDNRITTCHFAFEGASQNPNSGDSNKGTASKAMFGQGVIGQGMPMNAAVLPMLAAAGQRPAAFGINPAIGVWPNASFQAAIAHQGYVMGNSGYQNVGFQGPPGYQVNVRPLIGTQQSGGGTATSASQAARQRPSMGPKSGSMSRT